MTQINYEILDSFPYSLYAEPSTIKRGQAYFRDGRVWDVDLLDNGDAICAVHGDSGEYTVHVFVGEKGKINFECDCPYAEENFCKHMVAAGYELRDYLRNQERMNEDSEMIPIPQSLSRPVRAASQPVINWENKLNTVFSQLSTANRSVGNPQRYAVVILMHKEQYYLQEGYSFEPFVIKAKHWYPLQNFGSGDALTVNKLLESSTDWLHYGDEFYSQINPAGCLNVHPAALTLLYFLNQYSHYYGGEMVYITYFPMLAQMQIPIFLVDKSKKSVQTRLEILTDPVEVEVILTHQKSSFVLQAGLKDEAIPSTPYKMEKLRANSPWVLMGDKVFMLRDASYVPVLSSFPITIPEQQINAFRKNYLRQIAEAFPIKGDLIQWNDIHTDPIPRLYLHDDKSNILSASLRFAYAGHEIAATRSTQAQLVESTPDSWDLFRIHRQLDREQAFYQLLTDPNYRLKRADNSQPFGTFQLRAHAHPFDFLMHSIPLLTQAGFEIYGEEHLKLGKINRSTPTLRVNITSGIDWFDLKTVVEFGDQQISFHDVRKALKRGEHYIKLADGSVGQIPDEWMGKYKHLWNLANETTDGFRVSNFHLPLIDALLEGDAAIQIPPDLPQRRARFRNFEQITPQPLPEGFIGELRPYQKHGYDWLHFLREYNFGGILADDMGLGKTVQVLVFLQSLREQKISKAATLLVVPKSLITNWQRESEKFTPGLRFLEYLGNSRSKDMTQFDQYDIILTTYGTMLRDVELLRAYKFHYIVLDESQAIKNPLAKSAKAARLLNAEHRLVMTGTPVENNTFELWSQFAFLNPGLLGSMDFFKHEFANPIEESQDEQAAATLRKLVYPFILRRTKEQVAPELPPRTERIIYTDMDTAQKKLYNQTRDRYRSELLGLIESDGMNDARFKILEGLLRLRQIAIHPALVDSSYKGEAPKFEILLETLETLQVEHHKALVFSQFVETLRLIRQELDQRKIKYIYLDGKTPNRQSRVDLFQNDPSYPFFLISLKAGGVGLNLTAADYVIHLDPWWNPAVEMQASDRVHRIGQDKPVFVFKIIARDTVEEKILQLQERKRALVKTLITTESSFFKSLTRDDVKMLFE